MSSKPTSPVDQPEDAGSDAVNTRPAGNAPAGNPAESWSRGRIVWGKPPQEAFRAGPLPRDEGMARLMSMPPHPQAPTPKVSGSIAAGVGGEGDSATGRSIPLAQKPAAAPAPAPSAAPQPARPAANLGNFTNVPQARPAGAAKPVAPVGGGLFGTTLVPPAKPAQPQPAPKVEPAVAPDVVPEPAVSRAVAADPYQKIHELEPVVAKRRPVVEAAPIVEAPAPVTRDNGTSRSYGKWLLVGGSVVVIAAAALWWMNRQDAPAPALPATDAPSVTQDVLPDAVPLESAVPEVPVQAPVAAPVEAPAAATPATAPVATTAGAPKAAPRPEAARPAAPVPVRTEPVTTAPAPEPVVVTVPPKAEEPQTPPPAARPVETDPNAPMATNPYKRD